MSHRYNLRSKKNINVQVNTSEKNKPLNVILSCNTSEKNIKPLNVNSIQRDDIIYGNFNEGLCSNHFKEDLLSFISKWKDLIPTITDKMIENVKKTDYIKDPYNYLQVNNQLFEQLKAQSIVYIKTNRHLLDKKDYESVKTLFEISMFNEEITDLIINNTAKHNQLNYAKSLKEKLRRVALTELRKQLF
jgi:hypothetical protein